MYVKCIYEINVYKITIIIHIVMLSVVFAQA